MLLAGKTDKPREAAITELGEITACAGNYDQALAPVISQPTVRGHSSIEKTIASFNIVHPCPVPSSPDVTRPTSANESLRLSSAGITIFDQR
jgi:hypothetical protein